MKPGPGWEDALVYADYLEETNDEQGAARWRLLGHVQQACLLLWEEWGSRWGATALRRLHRHVRTKNRKVVVNERTWFVQAWFAPSEVIITLYGRTEDPRLPGANGHTYVPLGETAVRRSTIAKKGTSVAFRDTVARLVK